MTLYRNIVFRNLFSNDHGVAPTSDIEYHLPTDKYSDCLYFRGNGVTGIIKYKFIGNRVVLALHGHIVGAPGKTLDFIAANPIGRGYSYSGSGLPFANAEMAFENTPNHGAITTDSQGDFKLEIEYPNSYYVRQGGILVNPHVYLYCKESGALHSIDVGRAIPNRSLKHLPDRYNRTIGR
jgi:hypothetical protein